MSPPHPRTPAAAATPGPRAHEDAVEALAFVWHDFAVHDGHYREPSFPDTMVYKQLLALEAAGFRIEAQARPAVASPFTGADLPEPEYGDNGETVPAVASEGLRAALVKVTRQLHSLNLCGVGAAHRPGSWTHCPNRWCLGTRRITEEQS